MGPANNPIHPAPEAVWVGAHLLRNGGNRPAQITAACALKIVDEATREDYKLPQAFFATLHGKGPGLRPQQLLAPRREDFYGCPRELLGKRTLDGFKYLLRGAVFHNTILTAKPSAVKQTPFLF